jgi:hypothetical protein
MASDSFKVKNSINIAPGSPTMDTEGDIGFDSSTHKLKIRDNSATRNIVSEDGTATLTNKTISGASNTITNIPSSALAALTSDRAMVTDGSGFQSASAVTATELGYVSGVSSAIQTQIAAKAPAASPTFSGTITTPLTASRALVTGASSELAVIATTSTELGYVSGTTSSIQNQLNAITAAASSPYDELNYSLTATVAANALTIALKDASGSDPSGGSPVKIAFRNATAATGTYSIVNATAATSVVVSSGSTLGHTSAYLEYIYVYAINNAGTLELAVSTSLFNDLDVVSTTAEGGAGAADSATVMYSTTARTNVAFRLLGILQSTQTTAGTWTTAISNVSLRVNPRYTFGSRQVFTADGTWTRPAGCRAILVRVQAAGGGGGGAEGGAGTSVSSGGGGGAGGYTEKFFTYGFGSSQTVTVGVGGTAGAASGGGDGGDGEDSSFGTLLVATGGGGGGGRATISASVVRMGAAGVGNGASVSGDFDVVGEYGYTGLGLGTTGISGMGGKSYLGRGGRQSIGNVAGTTGFYGGGGSGGNVESSTTDRAGGVGGDGIIIVEEFY